MPTPIPPSTGNPSGRRVLVVDDDQAIRKMFSAALRRADFLVEVADNGRTALRSIADVRPDVVTLDLKMPGLDGFAVLDRLRSMDAPPAVVVVSGGDPDEMLSFGRPVIAVLSKPLHPHDLVAACERALGALFVGRSRT